MRILSAAVFLTFIVNLECCFGGVIVHRTFNATPPQGAALAWTGNSFFATDGNLISEFDLNGNLLNAFSSPGSSGLLERGLAYDGSHLWLFDRFADSSSQSMFYKLDSTGNVLDSFIAPAGAENLFGLAWDGVNLVGTSLTSNQLVRIDTSGNLVSTLDTDGVSLIGLGFDGTSFVSFDFNFPVGQLNQAIVRIDKSTGMVTGAIEREFGNNQGTDGSYHVFAYIGNDRWLLRDDFTSTSSKFVEASFAFTPYDSGGVVPEPGSLAIFGTICLLGMVRRRQS